MTAGADQRHQRFRIDAFDRVFAGRIDRRHHHRVGIVEAGREIVEQVAKPREAMRLRDRDDAALAGIARRPQHRLDLDRMMAVVVEYLHAVPCAGRREAALDAAERGEPLADVVRRRAPSSCATAIAAVALETLCRPGIGRRSLSIDDLPAGLAVADHHVEYRHRAVHVMAREAHVGLRVAAIGDDAAVLDVRDQRLHFRMIGAHDAEAVERHVLDELPESLPDPSKVP